jgi:hypothetical protein
MMGRYPKNLCKGRCIMKNTSVENMQSSNGNDVPNQFIIRTDGKCVFQSYSSVIVRKDTTTGRITLDANKWDYSKTTSKYRNQFLRETKAETEKKIKSGEYALADLNQ